MQTDGVRSQHRDYPAPLERGWFGAFGDAGGVECAFGVDAVGAVLFSGSAALGHHHAAMAGWSVCVWDRG